jgi:hypothetical protein
MSSEVWCGEQRGRSRPDRRYIHVHATCSTRRRQQGYCSYARTTTHYAEPSPALRASHRIASDDDAPATTRPLLLLLANSSGNRHDTTTDRHRHRSDNSLHRSTTPASHETLELSETRLLDTPSSARA